MPPAYVLERLYARYYSLLPGLLTTLEHEACHHRKAGTMIPKRPRIPGPVPIDHDTLSQYVRRLWPIRHRRHAAILEQKFEDGPLPANGQVPIDHDTTVR